MGLYDAILIKDNHIAKAGGVFKAVQKAREFVCDCVKVEVEVKSLDELKEALKLVPIL
jgi:nicotinate-nucleotide pyrophosphorylase (carboxylating)